MYAKGKFSNGPLYLGRTSNGRQVFFAGKPTIQRVQPVFLFSNFSCHIKTGNEPQGDLVGYGYKTNKVKIMAILLHVGKPIEPIN
jgi:hypothetical protein